MIPGCLTLTSKSEDFDAALRTNDACFDIFIFISRQGVSFDIRIFLVWMQLISAVPWSSCENAAEVTAPICYVIIEPGLSHTRLLFFFNILALPVQTFLVFLEKVEWKYSFLSRSLPHSFHGEFLASPLFYNNLHKVERDSWEVQVKISCWTI